MDKWTPGPWHVGKELKTEIRAENNCHVATAMMDHRSRGKEGREDYEYALGNAKLIAASPTMYKFIKKLADEGNADAAQIIKAI